MSTAAAIRIDFVSDVTCPWCAIGLNALERAIERVGDEVAVELHFQPFELNPQMAPEGEDAAEHLAAKYGLSPEQLARNRELLRERGEAVGFTFGERTRVYNTFDAHRLLDWAGAQSADRQRALKHALLHAYHGEGRDMSSHDVLVEVAAGIGLDADAARAVLASDAHAEAVRRQQRLYAGRGIQAVPSVIFDDQHLVQGGQPVEVFEQALRQLAKLAHTA
ncbi:DsbA family oxidoreductase [Marilutibacter maris]|uniref:DSBA oxidoreductase n=1 Tax=Marilutibacter maris TaxID=1605891 RepID=A0A2U9TB51_9GAMM|nr:DsbA family oxidoreductase [Lysobacter maris]AWV08585.1 DSBA oxidoreductase [Lysobacter maris]KAB8174282.1 DsbA family oxidoreductase [Lysobacter maris]